MFKTKSSNPLNTERTKIKAAEPTITPKKETKEIK